MIPSPCFPRPLTRHLCSGTRSLLLSVGSFLKVGTVLRQLLSQDKAVRTCLAYLTVVLFTSNGFASYHLIDFAEHGHDGSASGLLYSGERIVDCGVQTMTLGYLADNTFTWKASTIRFNHIADSALKAQIACTTASKQYFVVETSPSPPVVGLAFDTLFRRQAMLHHKGALRYWFNATAILVPDIAIDIAMLNPRLAPFSLQYVDLERGSIGLGYWTINLESSLGPESYNYDADIGINGTQGPMTILFQTDLQNELGATFQLFYWIYLADFGQNSPTFYRVFPVGGILQLQPVEFKKSSHMASTSSIFTDRSRYELVSNWTNQSLGASVPLFNKSNGLPLLPSHETAFVVSYACQERRLKAPLILIITVFVADFAFITGGYNLAIWIGVRFEELQKGSIIVLAIRANHLGRYPGISPSSDDCEKTMEERMAGVHEHTISMEIENL